MGQLLKRLVRRETGMELRMRESYGEGVAHHTGPESCAVDRKVKGEALTWVRTGQPLSGEINKSRTPTLLSEAEGHTEEQRYA
jgi:RNA-directed DNA polymerase